MVRPSVWNSGVARPNLFERVFLRQGAYKGKHGQTQFVHGTQAKDSGQW